MAQVRRIIRSFRALGATHPAAAILPAQHDIRESFVFRRLVQRGVLVAVGDGRYYLDEEAEARYRLQRQRLAMVLIGVALVLFVVSLLASR